MSVQQKVHHHHYHHHYHGAGILKAGIPIDGVMSSYDV